MNTRIITTLIQKDLALYLRNRFFAVVTVLSLVAYLAIYFLMPGTTEEKFLVAITPTDIPETVITELERRNMEVVLFDDEAAMLAAVENGDYRVGIVLPESAQATLFTGGDTALTAYYPPGIPADLNAAFNDLLILVFNEISYVSGEQPIRITRTETTLGFDLAGKQIPARDRLLPLFAVLLFMMETLGLANLIAEEISRGTLRALMITPMRLRELFIGKSITGVTLAFVQALILIGLTGKLGINPLLIITALFLGALLVTGVAFLIATVARDFMAVISWGMLAILVLGIPSVTVMFPGTVSGWVEVIPSFYLVDTLHRVLNFNAGWADITTNLALLAASSVAILLVGTLALERKLR